MINSNNNNNNGASHIEMSRLICSGNQMTDFYMTCNARLNGLISRKSFKVQNKAMFPKNTVIQQTTRTTAVSLKISF